MKHDDNVVYRYMDVCLTNVTNYSGLCGTAQVKYRSQCPRRRRGWRLRSLRACSRGSGRRPVTRRTTVKKEHRRHVGSVTHSAVAPALGHGLGQHGCGHDGERCRGRARAGGLRWETTRRGEGEREVTQRRGRPREERRAEERERGRRAGLYRGEGTHERGREEGGLREGGRVK